MTTWGTLDRSLSRVLRRRLPDFVVIGTMKSGTTTLFRWLDGHPHVQMPAMKEPNFFSDESRWEKGLDWYSQQFQAVPEGTLTGEASVSYTDPRLAASAARRLVDTAPEVLLVCVLRNPFVRMRSHYAHEVRRGRERRPFIHAISAAGNPYVLRSSYASALGPWVQQFPQEQLAVLQFETLFSGSTEWTRLLRFLDLPPMVRPTFADNVTATKPAFSAAARVLWERGWLQRAQHAPRPVRRLGRRLLLRPTEHSRRLGATSADPVPESVEGQLRNQMVELAQLLPDTSLLWDLDR